MATKPAIPRSKAVEDLYLSLDFSPKGLSEAEASKRLADYGPNEITGQKRKHPVIKFLSFFKNPLVLILLFAAAASGITGEIKSMAIIITMVILSVVMNFWQEHKSGRAAEEIAKKLSVRASVIRDGKRREVPTREIVPGDTVMLSAGDIIPADGVLLSSDDFFVNESSLTGESFPIEKSASFKKEGRIVFSGTNVVSGYCQFVAVKTGKSTEFGKIADSLIRPEEKNAFENGIRDFGYLIIKVTLAIVILIFAINIFKEKELVASLIFSIAVAVGVTPELLPVIISVNMSKGSISMAKKGVIVKRLNAIPDFGSMDILCTDKTGTLTQDRITVVEYVDTGGVRSEQVLRLAYLNGYFETGIKSLLDRAILEYKQVSTEGVRKIDEIPYDFMRKRSSVIYEEGGNRLMVTKGAPEEVFRISSHFLSSGVRLPLTHDHLSRLNSLHEDFSRKGFRVLAIATRDVEDRKNVYPKEEEAQMSLAGFVAFYDPPKEGAGKTLAFMREHGIEVKILTGDNALVTQKVCEDLGLEIKGVLAGDQLDINTMGDEALAAKALESTILARLTPMQKEKIISALRKRGLVVGYLGDGINDAPSLKSADVGISVDNAVDVAKETADIILMKKGLEELMEGVLEGRKTFGNTMKYLMMSLSSNFGNMFSMVGAALYLPFFPMMPGQILVNNLLYDSSQVAIPSDNVDEEYLAKPKHWDIRFIRNFMLIFGPISSLFDFLTFFVLYSVFGLHSSAFQTGWFVESLATQVLVIYIIRTRKIPFLQSLPGKYLLFSTLAAVTAGIVLTLPGIGGFFDFSPLPLEIFASIFALVSAYLLLVELVKRFFYAKVYPQSKI